MSLLCQWTQFLSSSSSTRWQQWRTRTCSTTTMSTRSFIRRRVRRLPLSRRTEERRWRWWTINFPEFLFFVLRKPTRPCKRPTKQHPKEPRSPSRQPSRSQPRRPSRPPSRSPRTSTRLPNFASTSTTTTSPKLSSISRSTCCGRRRCQQWDTTAARCRLDRLQCSDRYPTTSELTRPRFYLLPPTDDIIVQTATWSFSHWPLS